MKKSKKGQMTIYVMFLFAAILLTVIAAFIVPMGVRFNVEMYKAGEMILLDANESISGIQDPVIRDQVRAATESAIAASQANIDINTSIYEYSWILMIGLTALVIFLFTRQQTEFQQGGFN